MTIGPHQNAVTNTTHLLWVGRWVEAVKTVHGWRFKSGKDAADWILYPPDREGSEE